MPRGRDEMQVNVAGLRRNIKNLAHNYSDAQVKVREATSNDPWGPSSTLMAEIADLTYNVMAFTEIMQMIWKRLNDHGKNWRHVYKALVLMEYLIKTGSEKVALQCKENIFAIQTLKDFQYTEEGKDQGLNVREKAKQLVSLLKDEERLKNERARALKARQRFAQTGSAFGSDGADGTPHHSPVYPTLGNDWPDNGTSAGGGAAPARDAELARPLTAGEEELQLQLALAMSREEADREERRRRSDDVRLQLAISQSQQDFQSHDKKEREQPQSHLLDLLDMNLGNPVGPAAGGAGAPAPLDPWGLPRNEQLLDFGAFEDAMVSFAALSVCREMLKIADEETSSDPWSGVSSPVRDPWGPAAAAVAAPPPAPAPAPAPLDPWAPTSAHAPQVRSPAQMVSSPSSELEDFDAITNRGRSDNGPHDPFDLSLLGGSLGNRSSSAGPPASSGAIKKSPSAFLGENSSLVNLDNLIRPAAPEPAAPNPFAAPEPRPHVFVQPQTRITMNELKQQQLGLAVAPAPAPAPRANGADPWAPRGSSPWSPPATRRTPNPFLS
ncbi:Epsin-2 [Eumeta japonica]|uniref:Epsin-2 n=1 Tax=Eumeta variegata TaxID=151549 RepID=A0A4C1UXX9_EUMVA|nr:Epsin-2 [Eumeta japonica]